MDAVAASAVDGVGLGLEEAVGRDGSSRVDTHPDTVLILLDFHFNLQCSLSESWVVGLVEIL